MISKRELEQLISDATDEIYGEVDTSAIETIFEDALSEMKDALRSAVESALEDVKLEPIQPLYYAVLINGTYVMFKSEHVRQLAAENYPAAIVELGKVREEENDV